MNGYMSYRNLNAPITSYRNHNPSQPMYQQQPNYIPAQYPQPNYHQPYFYPPFQHPNGFQAYAGYNQVPMYPSIGNEHSIQQQQQLFQNPLQPNQNELLNGYKPYTNPYPKSQLNVKPPASGVNSIMNSFKSQDGSIDFNKMVNTAGQMMNAVNQVSTMIKGIGGIFKP